MAIAQLVGVRQLLDDFGGTDEASSARQHFPRNDRIVKFDRKVLLKAADGDAFSDELWDAPVGKKR